MSDETLEFDEQDNQEALIFARIVRYLSEQLKAPGEVPEEIQEMGGVLDELAQAFEATGGFEFSSEQALFLSQVFTVMETSMRALSESASSLEQHDAAAKIEWAAGQAKGMAAVLEERHLHNIGGIIAFNMEEEEGWDTPVFDIAEEANDNPAEDADGD